MTIGFSEVGMVTQACARVIPTARIAQTEVIANPAPPHFGFALRRRAQKSAGIGPVRRLRVDEFTNSPTHELPILLLAAVKVLCGFAVSVQNVS